MSAKGTYMNPSHKACFNVCKACFRCGDRGKYDKCKTCSGKHDPFGVIDAHEDDFCQCTQGILRFVTKVGQVRRIPYRSNPFKGEVTMVNKTEDERAWDEYVKDVREKLDDPTFEPVKIVQRGAHGMGGEFKYLGENYEA